MAIRKNTRRFDPRYFMDEKTDVVKEAYEPGRAVADLPQYNDEYDQEGAYDPGEEHMSLEEINEDEVQDLADKFNVEAFVEIASDGKDAIIVKHQDGKVAMYNDTESMYQDLASRMEMNEGAELKIPVEKYDAFKRKIEQWGMLFNKFTGYTRDLNNQSFDRKTDGKRIVRMAHKLESEFRKIMKEFDFDAKSYDDERYSQRQKLDRFDGDHEFFLEEGLENVTPENIQIAVEAFKQVAMNLAPAVVLPALMMAYKELKMSKKD